MPTKADKPELLICVESFVDTSIGGLRYVRDVTRVRVDDPIFRANPTWRKFFKPIDASHSNLEAATAAPGERRGD